MPPSNIFKVVFANQGKVYEIYARKVGHGTLFGFVEVEELIFGERSAVVVDPSEEKIKAEFAGVKRTYLPLHSVIRIDEVRKSGVSKVSSTEGSNVTQFPFPVYTPGDPGPRQVESNRCSSRAGRGRPAPVSFRAPARPAQVSRCSHSAAPPQSPISGSPSCWRRYPRQRRAPRTARFPLRSFRRRRPRSRRGREARARVAAALRAQRR